MRKIIWIPLTVIPLTIFSSNISIAAESSPQKPASKTESKPAAPAQAPASKPEAPVTKPEAPAAKPEVP